MNTPSLYRHKDRKTLNRKKQLIREIEVLWNREIPEEAGQAIPWSVLTSVVDALSERLSPSLLEGARAAIAARSVGDWIKLGATFGSPQSYETHASYFASIVVLNLFKKFPWTGGDLDPAVKARERFFEAEMLCRKTNARMIHYRQTDFTCRPLVKRLDVHQVFHLARRKIASWLGECTPAEILSLVKHGPGGCVGLNRPYTTPYYKFNAGTYSVSNGAYFHAARTIIKNDVWARALHEDHFGSNADDMFSSAEYEKSWEDAISDAQSDDERNLLLDAKSETDRDRSWRKTLLAYDARVEITDYNKVTFVPKDASTLRAIAMEPRLNVVLQLAVGTFMKGCLKRAGCDLTSQVRNQELAYVGSIQQDRFDPVTIDLRMASDCLSIELVRELLPFEWFEFLCSLRSENGLLDGKRIKWEKFSSMGNGFTFELESMIFYALAQSVSDHNGTTEWFASTFGPEYKYSYVSVFGDDIIVPQIDSEHLVKILRFCGFQTNHDKTFTSGPFRESCGKDFYNGVPVRPFYMKRSLSQVKDLIHLRNNLRGIVYDGLYELWETIDLLDSYLPPVLKRELVGPQRTTGDQYIWSDPDNCHTSSFVVWDTDIQTWVFPIMREGAVLAATVNPRFKPRLRWQYVQFLYANTGGIRELDSDESFTSLQRDAFMSHKATGGSSSDIVLSGQASPGRLTWQTLT